MKILEALVVRELLMASQTYISIRLRLVHPRPLLPQMSLLIGDGNHLDEANQNTFLITQICAPFHSSVS